MQGLTKASVASAFVAFNCVTHGSPTGTPARDDAATCVDESARIEIAWQDDLSRRAEEKFPDFEECGKAGKIQREERFLVWLTSEKDGTPKKSTVFTTLPDCAIADCIARKLDRLPRAPWPSEYGPNTSVDFFLRNNLPPRRMERARDAPFDFKKATRCGTPADSPAGPGRLAPEAIQSLVRSNYDKFRECYEAGLARDPYLTGQVSVRFVIERDGTVKKAIINFNTLPDCRVAACIRDAYPKLKFPAPEGGIVTVVYPIMLEPG
jgi:hypothetical protein